MPSTKTRFILGLAGLLAAAVPTLAQDAAYPYRGHQYERSYDRGEFRLWLGGFRPDATGAYFNGVQRDFTGSSSSDLQNVIGGIDYRLHLNPFASLLFSGSFYQGSTSQAYRNFVDTNGAPIRHNQSLDIDSFTAALMVNLAPPDSPVIPYLGAGGGLYYYRLREAGDFIDFTQTPPPVFSSILQSSGTTLGYYFLGGLNIPMNRRVALFVEGRLSRANKDLTGDFTDFGRIDLNGKQVGVGVAWRLW